MASVQRQPRAPGPEPEARGKTDWRFLIRWSVSAVRLWPQPPHGPAARPSAVRDFHKTPSAPPHGRAWPSRPRRDAPHRAPGAVRGSEVCVGRKDLLSWRNNAAVRKRFHAKGPDPIRGARPPNIENNPMHSSPRLSNQRLARGPRVSALPLDSRVQPHWQQRSRAVIARRDAMLSSTARRVRRGQGDDRRSSAEVPPSSRTCLN